MPENYHAQFRTKIFGLKKKIMLGILTYSREKNWLIFLAFLIGVKIRLSTEK